ncbi:MAG: hypothetical protein AAFX56_05120 [Pseudomonadota bacterium]
MITGIWYLGWLLSFVGSIGAIAELFGLLENLSNSEAMGIAPDSLIATIYPFLAALATALFGTLLVLVARPEKLRDWGFATSIIDWAENLPTDAPIEHLRFYGSLLALALSLSLVSSITHPAASALTPAHVLFAPLIGWVMVWAVLGFHLINPVAWAFPASLKFGSRFFHFVAVMNVVLAPLIWLVSGPQRSEVAVATAAMIGAAVGSTQFYRYWQTRLANRFVDSD